MGFLPRNSGERTSMNWWAKGLIGLKRGRETFVRALVTEEEAKLSRLNWLSAALGLPVYQTFEYTLPLGRKRILERIGCEIAAGWKVSVRVMDLQDARLIYRNLDVDVGSVSAFIDKNPRGGRYSLTVSPYKEPRISGTLLVRNGDACLEMVDGPHFWLTKGMPDSVIVDRCWYGFPGVSVEYSTTDAERRARLCVHLRSVVALTLGVNIRHMPELGGSLYAEYHWREDLGFRFLDCSYSPVWTGQTHGAWYR